MCYINIVNDFLDEYATSYLCSILHFMSTEKTWDVACLIHF